jgi:hypothetical protein
MPADPSGRNVPLAVHTTGDVDPLADSYPPPPPMPFETFEQARKLARAVRRADWALVVAFFSLLATGYLGWRQIALAENQVTLANRQLELDERQLALAETQTEIIKRQDELLARRADLFVTVRPGGPNVGEMEVIVTNRGRKAARDFSFIIRLPDARQLAGGGGVSYEEDCEWQDERQVVTISGLWSQPLYPTRSIAIGRSFLFWDLGRDSPELEWQIVSEDGAFPEAAGPDVVQGPEGLFGIYRIHPNVTVGPRPADLEEQSMTGCPPRGKR